MAVNRESFTRMIPPRRDDNVRGRFRWRDFEGGSWRGRENERSALEVEQDPRNDKFWRDIKQYADTHRGRAVRHDSRWHVIETYVSPGYREDHP